MSGEYLEILIFAAVAGFLIWRLRSVLGRRTGHERTEAESYPPAADKYDAVDNVVHLPEPEDKNRAPEPDIDPDSPLGAALTQIQVADRGFEPGEFLHGARAAFEMIIDAFASGDLSEVEGFLADDVRRNFAQAIKAREEAGETLESTLVSFQKVEIVDARMDGREAQITVKFVTEQSNVVRDSEGRIVDGDPSAIAEITDIWTFSRDTRSRDPNWMLVETASEN